MGLNWVQQVAWVRILRKSNSIMSKDCHPHHELEVFRQCTFSHQLILSKSRNWTKEEVFPACRHQTLQWYCEIIARSFVHIYTFQMSFYLYCIVYILCLFLYIVNISFFFNHICILSFFPSHSAFFKLCTQLLIIIEMYYIWLVSEQVPSSRILRCLQRRLSFVMVGSCEL